MRVLMKFWFISEFLLKYLVRLIRSSMYVTYDILTPKFHMKPAILKIPVQVTSDQHLLALVNLITMTPGTLTIDLTEDKKAIYIHAMYVKNSEDIYNDIKSLEKMIKRAF